MEKNYKSKFSAIMNQKYDDSNIIVLFSGAVLEFHTTNYLGAFFKILQDLMDCINKKIEEKPKKETPDPTFIRCGIQEVVEKQFIIDIPPEIFRWKSEHIGTSDKEFKSSDGFVIRLSTMTSGEFNDSCAPHLCLQNPYTNLHTDFVNPIRLTEEQINKIVKAVGELNEEYKKYMSTLLNKDNRDRKGVDWIAFSK